MNEQLQTLLNESLSHFHKRNLKKALNTALIALDFGMNEGAGTKDLLDANFLLARIFYINGKYQNEPSFWQKALKYASEARRLNELIEHPHATRALSFFSGWLNLSLKEYRKAESNFKEALIQAESLNDMSGIALAKLGLCELKLLSGQTIESIKEAEKVLQYLEENASPIHLKLWSEAYLQLSQSYIQNRQYSDSLRMSQQLLRVSRSSGDVEKEVIALRNIAVVCGVKSNYKIGMQYLLEALTKCETIGYRDLLLQLHINIGTIYAHLYNYPEAIKRYQLVLNEFEDVFEDKNKVVIYNNLGNIYLMTEHPELALPYFEKSFALAEESNFKEMTALTQVQLCRTKLELNRFHEAVQEAEWAEKIFSQSDLKNGYQLHLLNRAEIACKQKELEMAIDFAKRSIEVAKKMKDNACEIRAYRKLAVIFKKMKDFERALEYQDLYIEKQGNFLKIQQNLQFLDMEIRHAIREKEKEIQLLTKDNEYKAQLLQKTDLISQKNKELVRVNEDLKQFAYVASHDLKEPLRMIGSYSQLIHRKVSKHLDKDGHEFFQYISEGVNRMNDLLNGLLKYATVNNVKQKTEVIDLNRSLQVSMANLRSRIMETEAIIEEGFLPEIKGHHELMVQIFQNLISNALKFQAKGEKPLIKIDSIVGKNSTTIFVQDNGIGIPKQNQKLIFEIFQRLHSKENFEGTGIGLAICHKIAQRMNGKIWVESEEGNGATFYLEIPK